MGWAVAGDGTVLGQLVARHKGLSPTAPLHRYPPCLSFPACAKPRAGRHLLAHTSQLRVLDSVEQSCDTGNHLFKIPAVLKFWEAAATLQDAGSRFWLPPVAQRVED